MKNLNGFVFSKLGLIGSKSEGPIYFLQEFNYNEIEIVKKTNLWEEDMVIQSNLGKKVTIRGTVVDEKIVYEKISLYGAAIL